MNFEANASKMFDYLVFYFLNFIFVGSPHIQIVCVG